MINRCPSSAPPPKREGAQQNPQTGATCCQGTIRCANRVRRCRSGYWSLREASHVVPTSTHIIPCSIVSLRSLNELHSHCAPAKPLSSPPATVIEKTYSITHPNTSQYNPTHPDAQNILGAPQSAAHARVRSTLHLFPNAFRIHVAPF